MGHVPLNNTRSPCTLHTQCKGASERTSRYSIEDRRRVGSLGDQLKPLLKTGPKSLSQKGLDGCVRVCVCQCIYVCVCVCVHPGGQVKPAEREKRRKKRERERKKEASIPKETRNRTGDTPAHNSRPPPLSLCTEAQQGRPIPSPSPPALSCCCFGRTNSSTAWQRCTNRDHLAFASQHKTANQSVKCRLTEVNVLNQQQQREPPAGIFSLDTFKCRLNSVTSYDRNEVTVKVSLEWMAKSWTSNESLSDMFPVFQ